MCCFPRSFHEYVTQLVMKSNDCFNKASTTLNIADCSTHKLCFTFPLIYFLLVTAKLVFLLFVFSLMWICFCILYHSLTHGFIYSFNKYLYENATWQYMALLREWCPHGPSVCYPGCDTVSRQRQYMNVKHSSQFLLLDNSLVIALSSIFFRLYRLVQSFSSLCLCSTLYFSFLVFFTLSCRYIFV